MLSQFVDKGDVVSYMDNFWWREYFIVASVALAIDSTVQPAKTFLVEGGVCDGWSAWFALNCATAHSAGAEYCGYDSWEGMREDELLDSEIAKAGSYSYLSVDQTHRNLREFGGNVRLCKGFVPASLVEFDGPPSVHWLHIDLNAARPSVEMVAHFWNRIPRGRSSVGRLQLVGIQRHEETRRRVPRGEATMGHCLADWSGTGCKILMRRMRVCGGSVRCSFEKGTSASFSSSGAKVVQEMSSRTCANSLLR